MKKSFATIIAAIVMAAGIAGCKSEEEKAVAKQQKYVETSQAKLDSIPVGNDEELEMDADPTPEGEKAAGGYVTDQATHYIRKCDRTNAPDVCYEDQIDIFDRETDQLVSQLVENISLLPNQFQRENVKKELSRIREGNAECGNNIECRALVSARSYDFATWIHRQAVIFKEQKKSPTDVTNVTKGRYCASSDKEVKLYDGDGEPLAVMKPAKGKMLFFTVYEDDQGHAVAVESREKYEPFQFNGRILGYVNPAMREELTKGGHLFACEKLNYVYGLN